MTDGLNCRIIGDIIGSYFTFDDNGMLIPDPKHLRMDEGKRRFERLLRQRNGLARRLSEIYMRADGDMANRPLGSSPVISAGIPMFGTTPTKKMKYMEKTFSKFGTLNKKKFEARERKIENYVLDAIKLHKDLEPHDDPAKKLIWEVEGDQVYTGGGYDNTSIGDVTKSALNFIIRGGKQWTIENTAHSQFVVEECKALKEHLVSFGFKEGEFTPYGAHLVRFLQDTDGMIGWPVFAKANSPFTKDIALRLLTDLGVDLRGAVGTTVVSEYTGESSRYRVVDAIAYILDHLVISPEEMPSTVTTLVRIQRHGYKKKDNGIEAKDGKCRSIYPNAAIIAFIEAMTFTPFLEALKKRKVDFMPSLQDKETRINLIRDIFDKSWSPKDYTGLAADWSKYDATVKGCILASVIFYAVRPFFNSKWQAWVDASTYGLIYKYIIVNDAYAELNNDMFTQAKQENPYYEFDRWTVFGMINGLISGAKFTHGGGSMYGEVVIHRCIPRVLGFEPVWGPQAGDDTDMGVPRSRIDATDVTRTYGPIADAAAIYDLDMNVSKQMWHQYGGDPVQVFLQDIYQPNLDIFGVGSSFRYIVAAPFAERDKDLSIAEQELAVISKLENGYDNPFVHDVCRFWLERDKYLAALYKQYGSNTMKIIIDSVGLSGDEIRQRLGLGDFEWGLSGKSFDAGALPINLILADVASTMSVDVDAQQALSRMDISSDIAQNEISSSDPEEVESQD